MASKVETVSLDSWTVLWGVQSDVASKMAESRAAKKNYNVDEANITMTDWAKSKRPMKRILNLVNGSQIKYLILIARQKDEYETSSGGMDAKKTGRVIPDVMKGTEYDVNLALHFVMDGGKWSFETSKVQGSLIDLFPLGKKMAKFPFEEFFARFSGVDPSQVHQDARRGRGDGGDRAEREPALSRRADRVRQGAGALPDGHRRGAEEPKGWPSIPRSGRR